MSEPPDVDPPKNCSWLGEWFATFAWDCSMANDAEGDPVWYREALVHDGHEKCCHHTQIEILDRKVN